MYVSHPVRRIREDPMDGETVGLVLEFDPGRTTADSVAAAVRELGGSVENELPFETLEVSVAQPLVDDVCDLDGLVRVETTQTLALDVDGAGEDVEFPDTSE